MNKTIDNVSSKRYISSYPDYPSYQDNAPIQGPPIMRPSLNNESNNGGTNGSSNIVITIFLGILLLLLIGGVGYYLYLQFFKKKKQTTKSSGNKNILNGVLKADGQIINPATIIFTNKPYTILYDTNKKRIYNKENKCLISTQLVEQAIIKLDDCNDNPELNEWTVDDNNNVRNKDWYLYIAPCGTNNTACGLFISKNNNLSGYKKVIFEKDN